jgi:hypothetical protein
MTFTYKLARRLAILQPIGLTMSLLLHGCAAEDQLQPLEPGQDSMLRAPSNRLQVTPDSVTIEAGQSSRFNAFRIMRDDSAQISVQWSASGGTITADGAFSSAAPGRFLIVGESTVISKRGANRWESRSDTSVAIVIRPVPNLARVILSPDTATIASGQTRAFTAQGKLSDSSTTSIGVTWTATGGTVDASGLYAAGDTPGKHHVIATHAPGTLSDTATIIIPAPASVPAEVVLVPASATLAIGTTLQFQAYGRTAGGDSVAAAVGYTSTGGTIDTNGVYTAGTAAGTYRVIARLTGGTLADTASLTVTVATPPTPSEPPSGAHEGWYVAPGGSASAAGTAAAPWSLAHALAGAGGRIQPGDTVWVRGGTYQLGTVTANVAGTASAPVIIRGYPGERASLKASLNVLGAHVWYWGLEVEDPSAASQAAQCFNVKAPGVRIINNVIHDCSGDGIGVWVDAPNSEVTGNLLYNNGRYGNAADRYGHGIYFQNNTGTKLIRQNVVLNTFSHAFHGYSGNEGLNGLTLEDNVALNASQFVDYGGREYLIGGPPVNNLTFRRNHAYRVGWRAQTHIGYYGGETSPPGSSVTGNYIHGELAVYHFAGLTLTGNTVIGTEASLMGIKEKGAGPWTWNTNTYFRGPGAGGDAFVTQRAGTYPWDVSEYTPHDFASWKAATGFDAASTYTAGAPSGQKITVLKNPYEPGRAFIVVWNWSGAGSASADLSTVVAPGQAYEVRNAQRVWDGPLASGTGGETVSLPLAPVTPYVPLGSRHQRPADPTGTLFHVFLVMPK